MSNTAIIILVTVAACLVVFTAIVFLARYLSKRKINGAAILSYVGAGIAYAQSIADAIKPFLPNIADNVIEIVLKISAQTVARIEATYKAALITGTVGDDTRKVEAIAMIKNTLAFEGVPLTSDVEKLIDTVIPMLVMALPKTHDETTESAQVSNTPVVDTGTQAATVGQSVQ